MNKFIIDRFEGNYAICEQEDKTFLRIPKYRLPQECREGDCLVQDSEGMYQKNKEITKNRENRIMERMSRLFG